MNNLDMPIAEWNDEQLDVLKKWLTEMLQTEVVTLTFTKVDGTERVMKATLSGEHIPVVVTEGDTPKASKTPNKDVLSVYDVEAQGWRSLRWRSLKQIQFTLGAEDENQKDETV